jgi:hypothetical protein
LVQIGRRETSLVDDLYFGFVKLIQSQTMSCVRLMLLLVTFLFWPTIAILPRTTHHWMTVCR